LAVQSEKFDRALIYMQYSAQTAESGVFVDRLSVDGTPLASVLWKIPLSGKLKRTPVDGNGALIE
jgi:hypothetical protein